MFRAVYPKAPKFKYITQALAKISDEASFYTSIDGVEIKALSPDKTALIVVKLPSIVFEEYNVDDKESFKVASSEFNKVARRAGRNDALILELMRENNVVKVGYRDRKTGVEREFYVNLSSPFAEEIGEPELELTVTVRMLSGDLKQIVRDVKVIGEEALFHYRDNKLFVKTTVQQKEYTCELSEGNPLAYISSTKDEVKSTYSVDVLETVLKAIASSKNVTLQFDDNKPMRIEFELIGGGSILYWIAPRVE